MSYEEAIKELFPLLHTADGNVKEAFQLAICALAEHTKVPFVKCNKCGQYFRRYINKEEYNGDFTDYVSICPNCGWEFEWNDCYYR